MLLHEALEGGGQVVELTVPLWTAWGCARCGARQETWGEVDPRCLICGTPAHHETGASGLRVTAVDHERRTITVSGAA